MNKLQRDPARRMCLGGCDQMFDSKDKFNRICPKCSKRNSKERTPRTMSSRIEVDGSTISLEGEEP